jgi:allophanate hydrolase subunit 2
MGIRMEGPHIEGNGKNDIISDGIVFGSIQITSAGLPIVMMADHQTTGGYAKIATVIKEDLPKLAQARPGSQVIFQKVEIGSLQRNNIFSFVRKIGNYGVS